MAENKFLLFADQTCGPAHSLKRLIGDPSLTGLLHPFFDAVNSALRDEARSLTAEDLKAFGSAFSVVDMAVGDSLMDGYQPGSVALSTVQHCICQIASLVIKSASNPENLGFNGSVNILGLCTGFLAALVAGYSTDQQQVIKIGSQLVRVALRLGLEVHRRSRSIENSSGSWSTVIRGASIQQTQRMIDEFNASRALPVSRQMYISSWAFECITVSGPPSTLSDLFRNVEAFQEANHSALPIYGAFHAPHLPPCDIGWITEPFRGFNKTFRDNVTIISACSGEAYNHKTFDTLLREGLNDILHNKVYPQIALDAVANRVKETPVRVAVLGPTGGTTKICQYLNSSYGWDISSKLECPAQGQIKRESGEKIAVVGMGGRFPGSSDLDGFWRTLEEGMEFHQQIPSDRFDTCHFNPYKTTDEKGLPAPYACLIDDLGSFDTSLFRMSAREAKNTDPMQRQLMTVTYEALQQAGYGSEYAGKIGTFVGQTTDDWREFNTGEDPDIYYVSGTIRAFGPGRLNYFFKWDGPSYSIDTACSSSFASIQVAYHSLLQNDCDMAIAGGGNVLTGPNMFRGLMKGGFLSSTGGCKTFDSDADGYCRGEAVGVVVLKRLRDAIADNDNIYGVIEGISTNHSAHAISITHPHQETQESLHRHTFYEAGISPSMVDYVELHGTGTQAGDKIEVSAVANALGGRRGNEPIYIGSIKANMGHSEAAAGITSLIKALMMFRKNKIPPHVGVKTQMKEEIASVTSANNLCVPVSNIPFHARSADGCRRILVNNFNATGGNTSLIIADYRKQPHTKLNDHAGHYVVAISAKSQRSLEENRARLLQYVESNKSSVKLGDLAYTSTARRLHSELRTSYIAKTIDDLLHELQKAPNLAFSPANRNKTLHVAFTFIGQGCGHRGLAYQPFLTSTRFRQILGKYDAINIGLGFPSFLDYLLSGDDRRTVSPVVEQIALVALEVAVAELWQGWGVQPRLVIGHSLGEYAALCVAGALSISDTIFLVGKRACLMEELCRAGSHGMLAVNLDRASALAHCASSSCELSCINSPTSTVLSGPHEELMHLQRKLSDEGVRNKLLDVPYAFHSEQISPILDKFREVVNSVPFKTPTLHILSPLLQTVLSSGSDIQPEYLIRHAREPVDFVAALESGQALYNGDVTWLECGPGPGCLAFISRMYTTSPSKLLSSLKEGADCTRTIASSMSMLYNEGHNILWSQFYREHESEYSLIELPTYAFDMQNYWIDGVCQRKEQAPLNNTIITSEPHSTSVQHLKTRSFLEGNEMVTFTTNPRERQLFEAIKGHSVIGFNLCPSSVYVDIAVTSATYLKNNGSTILPSSAIEVTKFDISRPLVVSEEGSDIQISIMAKSNQESDTASVSISSQQDSGQTEHAQCNVTFCRVDDWASEWARYADFVSLRIQQLTSMDPMGDVCRISGKALYRLFAAIVDYAPHYHAISEMFIDCDQAEACGTIALPASSEHGTFTCSPYSIDSIIHFAGFILNNSMCKTRDQIYVSNGWKSLRVLPSRLEKKEYQVYSRMCESGKKGQWVGDVYLLDGRNVVATCFGLSFQGIRPNILQSLLEKTASTDQMLSRQNVVQSRTLEIVKPLPRRIEETSALSQNTSTIAKVIARELQIDVDQLPLTTAFEQLGLDSILSVSIANSVKQETGLAVPSTLFSRDSTLSQLLDYIKDTYGVKEQCRETSIPETPASGTSIEGGKNHFETLLSIVASETSIEIEKLDDDVCFQDLGVDSLMSMAIISAFRDTTGMSLPTTIFSEFETIQSIREFLIGSSQMTPVSNAMSTDSHDDQPTYQGFGRLLQGDPSSSLPPIFLVAPGSGYPGSYMNLPPFKNKQPVYTLESPFLQGIPAGGWTIEYAATLYITEIQRIKPIGPYILGGWSIGGMYSYEIARQFSSKGQEVIAIVLIDSPCPKGFPVSMPDPTIEALEVTGLYAPIKRHGGQPDVDMPMNLKEHTVYSLKALRHYAPPPLDPSRRPRHILQIWASKGEYDLLPLRLTEVVAKISGCSKGPDVYHNWQTMPRTSFGPCGWDLLVGDIECLVLEGDHESIMSPPAISKTGQLIQNAIDRALRIHG
ncbi:hypothetical protein BDV27DRAFT_160640 [Aspergillus caelatus]|uniref:Uncharacterized protein n=1 Tax=Aspergillus caelatus TaxID=61420 RepID=A0A5N6ZVA7_9EURO|nr:uncharacterized protein BDV27DRAFT_160640 [Aspergillus caelatus]KAE8361497.1 hypothetical protein BDV27DRAFT_160640 [Aspergillus caelatus]